MRTKLPGPKNDDAGDAASVLFAEIDVLLAPGWELLRADMLRRFDSDCTLRAATPGASSLASATEALAHLRLTCDENGVREALRLVRRAQPELFRSAAALGVEVELDAALSRRIEQVLAHIYAEGLRRCEQRTPVPESPS